MSAKMMQFMSAMDNAWPFKRVSAPQHLLEKYNKQFDKRPQLSEFAINVAKDVDVTDDMIWSAMTTMVNSHRTNSLHNPPITGMEKTTLL